MPDSDPQPLEPQPASGDGHVSTRDPQVVERIDALVRQFGGDPATLDGELVREMMQTALRLLRDGADTGELKLVSRSLRELRYALKIFREHRHERKISIFGSARTPAEHPDYQAALDFARGMTDHGWMAITGAGPGIMQAGHEGAGAERSFGVSILLPMELGANQIIAGDPKLVTFRYFFTRKLIFVSQADALALFPGGFGTLDECFEVLTLVQTGKAPLIPIAMIEPPGSTYWQHFDAYVRDQLLANSLVDPEDLRLYRIFDDPRDAVAHVLRFYQNFHSQRYVHSKLVLRMNRPLSPAQVEGLNDEFHDIVSEGRIEQVDPFPEEHDHLDLPRLAFHFTRRSFGRLRMLIDRINDFAEEA